MKNWISTIWTASVIASLMLFAFGSLSAAADQDLFPISIQTVLQPDRAADASDIIDFRATGPRRDPFGEDWITYDDDNPTVYYMTPNLYARVVFTPNAAFQLQGYQILPYNVQNSQAPINTSVYRQNDNQNLTDRVVVRNLNRLPEWDDNIEADWIDVELDEEDYVQFEANESFSIVYGVCPGGDVNQNGAGYWPMGDGATQVRRSYVTRVNNAQAAVPANHAAWSQLNNDLMIRANGEYQEDFIDVEVIEVFNGDPDVPQSGQYFMLPGTEQMLKSRITNQGADIEAMVLNFLVLDADGNEVFAHDMVVENVASGDTMVVECEQPWSSEETGRYKVFVTAFAEGDANQDNDVAGLDQIVFDPIERADEWLGYDDNSAEASTGGDADLGWAAMFTHPGGDIPLVVTQIRAMVLPNDGNAVNVPFSISVVNLEEMSLETMWQGQVRTNGQAELQWLEVGLEGDNQVTFWENQAVLITCLGGNIARIASDTDPPSAGVNAQMPFSMMTTYDRGDSFQPTPTSDYLIQTKFGVSDERIPGPHLAIHPDTLYFGDDLPIGAESVIEALFVATGQDSLSVTNIITPLALRPYLTINPRAFVVPPGDTTVVTLTFRADQEVDIRSQVLVASNWLDHRNYMWRVYARTVGQQPPEIQLSVPDGEELVISAQVGVNQAQGSLTVRNGAGEGGADLRFTAEITNQDQQRAAGIDLNLASNRARALDGGIPQRDEAGEELGRLGAPYDRISGLAWDGELMWGLASGSRLFAVDLSSGDVIHDFEVRFHGPHSLAFDGTNLWIGSGSDRLANYSLDGQMIQTVGLPANDMTAVAANGEGSLFIIYSGDHLLQLSVEGMERMADYALPDLGEGESYGQIGWATAQPDAPLWAHINTQDMPSLAQLVCQEGVEVSIAQRFEVRGDDSTNPVAHDGNDLWTGMNDAAMLYQIDDGVIEAPDWLTVDPTEGALAPGEEATLTLTCATEGMQAREERLAALKIASNDPANPELTIPIRLTIDSAEEEEVISYEDPENPSYFFTMPNRIGDRGYNVRFTPTDNARRVVGMRVMLFDLFGEAGQPGMRVAITGSEEAAPADVLAEMEIPAEDLILSPRDDFQWTQLYFADYGVRDVAIQQDRDFHIVLDAIQNDAQDTLAVISDDGSHPTNRSGVWSEIDGRWIQFVDLPGIDVGLNFFLEAIVAPEAEGGGQTIQLAAGWNTISLNVTPGQDFWRREEGPDVIAMLAQIPNAGESLVIFKDDEGRFYLPAFDFVNIPYWSLIDGYQIRVTQAVEVTWPGEPIAPQTEIPLEAGWNTVPYYPTYDLDASAPDYAVLASITDRLYIAKDDEGRFILPDFDFSNMADWTAGEGYQVKVDGACSLIYPEAPQMAGHNNVAEAIPSHWTRTPTAENLSLLVTDLGDIAGEVAAFNTSGEVAGVGVIQSGRCGLAVWGDDPSTAARDGLSWAEAFTLRLYDASSTKESSLPVSPSGASAGLVYTANDVIVAKGMPANLIPSDFYLGSCFPDPFNSTTRIEFGMPRRGEVSLVLYDAAGRRAETLLNGEVGAGNHSVVISGEDLAAGLYFVKLSALGFESTRRVVLIK